ncbi:Do family serine endopeptidase [Alphaproteobacteria bacterium]|jgi:serine protease Do|nr:Do family serine endopeptidase [Alphaproteobacteria bacterium]MDB2371531.1 Do family serine endopeptidase [Alphaproteobacteria bacterium]
MKKVLSFSIFSLLFFINNSFAQFERGYADLVEKLLPSVVSIATSQIIERRTGSIPELPEGHPFNDMFEDFFGNQMPKRENMTGLGSGFIISPEGYVVTNNHVISGADQITVIFNNGIDEVPAELVGTDPKTDIAVLKIDPNKVDIENVTWGDSSNSRVGDIVLAIGNPLGLGGTVTSGIISSINRDIGSGPYVDFIQTDAPINRGNSGGPLFNLDGEVIGINSMIISQTGGSVGLGFSIPANTAKLIVEQIISFGQAKRGWLGVQIQDLTPEFSESLGYDSTEGAFVASVSPESPAAKSNIQAGDIIIKFDGKKISSFKDLPKVVAETPIGNEVKVSVWRNGGLIEINVKIDELDEGNTIKASSEGIYIEELDITLVELDQENAEMLGIEPSTSGLLIKSVGENNKSLMTNDVIIQVSSEKISDLTSFQKMVSDSIKLKRDKLLLRVIREGNEFWLINPLIIE